MNAIVTKTFRSANGVAVDLPAEIAFAADTAVSVERNGDVLTIRPVIETQIDWRERWTKMIEDMRAIGPIPRDPVRDADERIEFPDRPGL